MSVFKLFLHVAEKYEYFEAVAVHIRYRAHNAVMGPVSYMDGDRRFEFGIYY